MSDQVSTPDEGPLLRVTDYGALLCPFCGFNCTHVDEVSAGIPLPSGCAPPHAAVTFSAVTGKVEGGPQTDLAYSRDRHWLEIHIDCEGCPGGTIILAQHKGETRVSMVATAKSVTARGIVRRGV